MLHISFHSWIHLAKFWPSGGEGRLSCSWSVTKSVIKQKSKALKSFYGKFCRQSSTRNINLDFSLEQLRWLPLKWLILRQNETQGTRLGFPSPPYWVFFTPTLWVCTGVRRSVLYADVRTKFSWIHRFSIFSANFSSLRARWRSAIINFIIIMIILNGCIVLLYC